MFWRNAECPSYSPSIPGIADSDASGRSIQATKERRAALDHFPFASDLNGPVLRVPSAATVPLETRLAASGLIVAAVIVVAVVIAAGLGCRCHRVDRRRTLARLGAVAIVKFGPNGYASPSLDVVPAITAMREVGHCSCLRALV
jgi:hypothetical protein